MVDILELCPGVKVLLNGFEDSPWKNNKLLIMLLWTVQEAGDDYHKFCPGVKINLIFLAAHP